MSIDIPERQTCDSCGSQVHTMSLDVMVSVTMYEDDGEIRKTMEEVTRMGDDIIEPDDSYLVICSMCARYTFKDVFSKFLAELRRNKS